MTCKRLIVCESSQKIGTRREARVRRSGVSRYSHWRPLLVHIEQNGRCSSHFLCLLLHTTHPDRTFGLLVRYLRCFLQLCMSIFSDTDVISRLGQGPGWAERRWRSSPLWPPLAPIRLGDAASNHRVFLRVSDPIHPASQTSFVIKIRNQAPGGQRIVTSRILEPRTDLVGVSG